jgi:hypothetical protein
MSSSWESARILAYEILMLFPTDLEYFNAERVKFLYDQAVVLINNPVIKWYENGALLLTWLF